MCGITGIINLNNRPVDRSVLKRMCSVLEHRGPDAEGYWLNSHAGLGQRRLSVIDLTGGRQPMSNEDETVWVTFNGEIYNFREVRDQLEAHGHRFATDSDTEVIVHAWEEDGSQCVERFRGMFAFAVWDCRQQTLFVARDRVGKKPVYYAQVDGCFLFASELQALLAHPAVSREINLTDLDDYLTYGYVPAPKTIFRQVQKLPPAHFLLLQPSPGAEGWQVHVERYWQLAYEPKCHLSVEEAIEQLQEVLSEAVRLRMIADVPLGALLSGGIDSSLVVAFMSQLSNSRVKTFSIGFDEPEFNELSYARLVAERYHTEHHEFIVRPKALDVLPLLVRHYGEPFADSSALPSYFVSQITREHVKVALNGDGGDECFAGYDRYFGQALANQYCRLPNFLRRGLLEPAAGLIPHRLSRRNRLGQAKRFLQVAAQAPGSRYLRWVTLFTADQKQELYTRELQSNLAGHSSGSWLLDRFEEFEKQGCEPLDVMLRVDVESYLPYDLLVKMDIASMACSLEARSPFLDHKVMEFAARLPGHLKLRGQTLKYLLKRLSRDLLPPAAYKRRKMGFGVPVGQWMRTELRDLLHDALLSSQALHRGYFQEDAVAQLVQLHDTGKQDCSSQLWALLWLELWHREFID